MTVLLNFMNLGLNELVSDLSHGRKIRYIHLEHDEDHSSIRRRHLDSSVLSPVETQPLQIGIVYDLLYLRLSSLIVVLLKEGIVPLLVIRSLAFVVLRSFYFDLF